MFLTHALRAILRTAVATGDALWKYVSLLLSGTPPTQTFIADASVNANVLTLNGDVRPSNLNPYVEGYYSNYFDGSGDYLTVPANAGLAMGTGDFTVEFWVYKSTSGSQAILDYASTGGFGCAITDTQINAFATVSATYAVSAVVPLNTWNHIAFVRSGTTLTTYLNGVSKGTNTTSANFLSPSTLNIGRNAGTGTEQLNGYISNLRLVKGTAVYTANFTPPTTPLTAIANTSLLTCQSNRFIDNSANNFALTRTGDVAVRGFVPFTPPTTVNVNTLYSTYFSGTGDGLITPTGSGNLVTTDFTWEAWVNFSSLSTAVCLIASGNTTDRTLLYYDTSLGLRFAASRSTVDQISVQQGSTAGWSANTWYHVALVRNGNVYTLYRNGVSIGTSTNAYAQSDLGRGLTVGYSEWSASYLVFTGLMSNVRVVNGTAVYTANFTPATTNLTAITNTRLLTCQSSTIRDNSTNAFVLTAYGQTRPIAVSPFTQVTTPVTATYLGSGYFDGSGDTINLPTSTALLGAGNYTVEFWVNLPAAPTGGAYFTVFAWGSSGSVLRCFLLNETVTKLGVWIGATNVVLYPTSAMVGQWAHIALVRSGTTLTAYINGVSVATASDATNYNTGQLYVASQAATNFLTGYISNFRIVVGTAVYTANFAPPATPLTAVANTSLLTLQTDQPAANKQFIDNSGSNLIVTQAGNATQGSFSPYGANWSNYFDGTGDYLQAADNSALTLGAGNFTIECWFYITGNSASNPSSERSGQLVTKFQNTSNYYTLYVLGNSTTTGNALRLEIAVGGVTTTVQYTATITQNQWHHFAAVRNGSGANNVVLYFNGISVATATNIASDSNTGPVYIGYYGYPSYPNYFNGYISNARIVKGTAVYTAAFTPPTAPLTPIAGTSLLTCQSPSLVDNSINGFAITRNGDVSVQRFSPFSPVIQAPVSYSTYFDGTGDYLSAPDDVAFTMGSGDFTIECWINLSTLSGSQMVIGTADAPGNQGSMSFVLNVNSGTPRIGVGYGNAVYYATAASTITANTWVHLAGVRNGASVYIYVNGVQSTALNMASLAINDSTQIVAVGRNGNYNGEYVTGYISNVRIVKGTAVYTANFTPPTAPLTAISGTSLLTCQSATIVDNSSNAFAITTTGDARARTQNPFGFTNTTTGTAYTPALYGGSAYFDGTGDYLDVVSNAALEPGSGDFTAELWVYPTAYPASGTGAGLLLRNNSGVTYSNFTTNLRSNGQVEAYFSLSNPASVPSIITGGSVPLGAWAHIALVKTGLVAKLFVNGVLVGTATNGSNPPTGLTTGTWLGKADGSLTGYISDARITKGQALYTGGFVPPIAPLQAVKNTVLLLNMDKSGITDSSRCVDLETVGDAKIRYESPYSGSYYSNYFDGSGDYLSIPSSANLAFGTGNFCVELWYYQSTSAVVGLFSNSISSGSGGDTQFEIQLDSSLRPQLVGWASVFLTSSISSTLNIWNHLVVNRSGTTVSIFLNGTRVATAAVSNNFSSTNAFNIGRQASNAGYLTGFVSNLRVTKGSSVYDPTQSTITVPTQPLAVIANTELLTCQSKSFVDNSSNNFTITRSGDVAVRSYNPFQANIANSSMYFDGSGDYLSVPANRQFMFGGNLTIEFWVYFTTVAGTQDLIGNYVSNVATDWIVIMSGTGIQFYPSGSSSYVYSGAGTAIANTWYHVAAVRSGSTCSLYVNGISVGTPLTVSTAVGDGAKPVYIGARSGPSSYFSGYIADLRITNGAARYTANFTPPTAPLPTS